jgi:hypothetical protein
VCILPTLVRRSSEVCPERELAAAVFCQAANDLKRFRCERRQTTRSVYADAHNWIASNDRSWPYSFLNLCDALHLAADDVRAELLGDKSPRLKTSAAKSSGSDWHEKTAETIFGATTRQRKNESEIRICEGKTWLSYDEPSWIVKRHGLGVRAEVVDKLAAALSGDLEASSTGYRITSLSPKRERAAFRRWYRKIRRTRCGQHLAIAITFANGNEHNWDWVWRNTPLRSASTRNARRSARAASRMG